MFMFLPAGSSKIPRLGHYTIYEIGNSGGRTCWGMEIRILLLDMQFEVPMRHLKVNILQALRPMGLKCGEVPGLNIKMWRALACS